jgi:hypothetical protein
MASSVDKDEQPVLQYCRGYIERDLRPESLWSRATATGGVLMYGRDGQAASSSGGVGFGTANLVDKETELRTQDIITYRDLFLGPPKALWAAVPAAMQFSKAAPAIRAFEEKRAAEMMLRTKGAFPRPPASVEVADV